jgi:hypothetical protein
MGKPLTPTNDVKDAKKIIKTRVRDWGDKVNFNKVNKFGSNIFNNTTGNFNMVESRR